MIPNHDAEFWPKYFCVLLCKSMVTVLLLCPLMNLRLFAHDNHRWNDLTLPRIRVFHNKPSSSRRHFCRGFHLRRTQISNLPSRNLCYNTCNIINKDLWAMRRTNYIVIANSNGIKHLYLSLTGINLRVCDFKMLKLRLDRNLTRFLYIRYPIMYHLINWHLSFKGGDQILFAEPK